MRVVKIGSARIDERGKISGGVVGDNTGIEVSYQNWYLHSKGWVVIRAKDDDVRIKIACAMVSACNNNNIGYDQSNRSGLYNAVKNVEWNPAKCTVKTECDCSALVRVCVAYALGKAVADFNTSSEVSVLKATGAFDILTDAKYTTSQDYLLEGDILVTKSKGHTVVALNNGDKAFYDISGIAKYTLNRGKSGIEVAKLQKNLNQVINAGLTVDGEFGTKTDKAVRDFQTKYKLEVDGKYGPKSYNKMVDVINGNVTTQIVKIATYTLRRGTKGNNVKTLQENINMAIGSNLKVDGNFGPDTESALRRFQSIYGLVVDGIYGKNSYTKMKSVLNT